MAPRGRSKQAQLPTLAPPRLSFSNWPGQLSQLPQAVSSSLVGGFFKGQEILHVVWGWAQQHFCHKSLLKGRNKTSRNVKRDDQGHAPGHEGQCVHTGGGESTAAVLLCVYHTVFLQPQTLPPGASRAHLHSLQPGKASLTGGCLLFLRVLMHKRVWRGGWRRGSTNFTGQREIFLSLGIHMYRDEKK